MLLSCHDAMHVMQRLILGQSAGEWETCVALGSNFNQAAKAKAPLCSSLVVREPYACPGVEALFRR